MTLSHAPIEMRGLSKCYRERAVLDALTLSIPSATCFCLLGRNGAGKTTALQLLMGLRNPTSGEAWILGTNLRARAIHQVRRRIGYLPEPPILYQHLTGREHLEFIAELHGTRVSASDRIEEGIASFDLADVADMPIRTYSTGMRKQIAFLAATLPDPEVLILDEPTGTLDTPSVRRVRDVMMAQRDRGRTVLFTTHSLELAERVADRIAILHDGTLRFAGPLGDFRARHGPAGTESLEDLFLGATAGTRR